jgi:DNA-binding transcriptional regulator YiaG
MNARVEPRQFIENFATSMVVQSPLMSREKFAELCGVSVGVVQGWIARGYLPMHEMGKYRLINVIALTSMLLPSE